MKKGFTLIELLGIIIILSAIILVVVPNITKSLRNSKDRLLNVQLEEIVSATKSWTVINSNNLPSVEGAEIRVSLLQLKLANLIPSDIKNPKTNELFFDDMQIKVTKKGLNYFYEVLLNTGSSNISTNPLGPTLTLNGSINELVEINTSYSDLGATAKDNLNNNVAVTTIIKNSSNVTINNIDTSVKGKYLITYTATKNGNSNSITREVSVVDTIKPVITIASHTDNEFIELESVNSYTLPLASVVDNSNELLAVNIVGNFSTLIPGNKKVIYEAIDSSGNKGTFTLNYIVKDTGNPNINSIELEENPTTQMSEIIVYANDNGVGLHDFAYSFDNGASYQRENYFAFDTSTGFNNTIIVRDKSQNITSEHYSTIE